MDKNILVTYASKYGATEEIALKIGEVLLREGLQADVIPVDSVQNLTLYQAVILGSAIYIGNWQKEAVTFLQRYAQPLSERKVWIFSSGPTGDGDPVELVEGQRLPAALQPVVDGIQPRDIAVFHGYINPDKLNFLEKWAIKSLVKKPFGDYRNWEMIVDWTTSVANALKEVKSS